MNQREPFSFINPNQLYLNNISNNVNFQNELTLFESNNVANDENYKEYDSQLNISIDSVSKVANITNVTCSTKINNVFNYSKLEYLSSETESEMVISQDSNIEMEIASSDKTSFEGTYLQSSNFISDLKSPLPTNTLQTPPELDYNKDSDLSKVHSEATNPKNFTFSSNATSTIHKSKSASNLSEIDTYFTFTSNSKSEEIQTHVPLRSVSEMSFHQNNFEYNRKSPFISQENKFNCTKNNLNLQNLSDLMDLKNKSNYTTNTIENNLIQTSSDENGSWNTQLIRGRLRNRGMRQYSYYTPMKEQCVSVQKYNSSLYKSIQLSDCISDNESSIGFELKEKNDQTIDIGSDYSTLSEKDLGHKKSMHSRNESLDTGLNSYSDITRSDISRSDRSMSSFSENQKFRMDKSFNSEVSFDFSRNNIDLPTNSQKDEIDDGVLELLRETKFDVYLHREKKYQFDTEYMDRQPLSESMRCILIDWIVDVHLKFRLLPETFFLAVNIIDRFSSLEIVSKDRYQLLGTTSLWLATKYEEHTPPKMDRFVKVAAGAFTRDDLIQMEDIILSKLEFNLTVVTPFHFLKRFLHASRSSEDTKHLSFYFSEICSIQYSMIKYLPSEIASACIYLSQLFTDVEDPWNSILQSMSQKNLNDFRETTISLYNLLIQQERSRYTASKRKFRRMQYNAVADRVPPRLDLVRRKLQF